MRHSAKEAVLARRVVNGGRVGLLHQQRGEGADTVPHAPEIDIEMRASLGRINLPHLAAHAANTGIVEKEMDTAELIKSGFGERRPIILRSHIARARNRANAGGGFIQLLARQIGQHHFHAFAGKHFAHCKANPACPARDDSGLRRECAHIPRSAARRNALT